MSETELARLKREYEEAQENYSTKSRLLDQVKQRILGASPEVTAAYKEWERALEAAGAACNRLNDFKKQRRQKIETRLKSLADALGMDEDDLLDELREE